MRRLVRRARSLSGPDWLQLARAMPVVTVSRVALWMSGVRAARRAARAASRFVGVIDTRRAPWAVTLVSRAVPAATCLTQAIALQALFEHAGCPCRLEIGVSMTEAFEAHAWVVCGNEVVLGDVGHSRFERVAVLD